MALDGDINLNANIHISCIALFLIENCCFEKTWYKSEVISRHPPCSLSQSAGRPPTGRKPPRTPSSRTCTWPSCVLVYKDQENNRKVKPVRWKVEKHNRPDVRCEFLARIDGGAAGGQQPTAPCKTSQQNLGRRGAVCSGRPRDTRQTRHWLLPPNTEPRPPGYTDHSGVQGGFTDRHLLFILWTTADKYEKYEWRPFTVCISIFHSGYNLIWTT